MSRSPIRTAVSNAKGGVGKTTTVVALGHLATRERLSVLAIDLDPTHTLTIQALGGPTPDSGEGLTCVLTGRGELADVARPSLNMPGFDVVPGGARLHDVAALNSGAPGGGQMYLRRAIERLGDRYDVILIDCPPTALYLLNCALAAAHYVLAPCEAEPMSLAGLATVTHAIAAQIELGVNPGLEFVGVVGTNVDARRKLTAECFDQLRLDYGDLVFESYVRADAKVAQAFSHARPPTHWSGKGSSDYRDVFREFSARVGV